MATSEKDGRKATVVWLEDTGVQANTLCYSKSLEREAIAD